MEVEVLPGGMAVLEPSPPFVAGLPGIRPLMGAMRQLPWLGPFAAAGAGGVTVEEMVGTIVASALWVEQSESDSGSGGLGRLGEVLRLSWSMSLRSLMRSSLRLGASELSPSEGDPGGDVLGVLGFLGFSASSPSERLLSRKRLPACGGGVSASGALLCLSRSVLSVLVAPGDVRPHARESSAVGSPA